MKTSIFIILTMLPIVSIAQWRIPLSVGGATEVLVGEPQNTLKAYCEKGENEYMVKNSVTCKFVRGEHKLDQLCEGFAKNDYELTKRLKEIVEKYAELKSIDSDTTLQQLCAKQISPEAIAVKPECTEEREGKFEAIY